jgi:hypothetical protein
VTKAQSLRADFAKAEEAARPEIALCGVKGKKQIVARGADVENARQ